MKEGRRRYEVEQQQQQQQQQASEAGILCEQCIHCVGVVVIMAVVVVAMVFQVLSIWLDARALRVHEDYRGRLLLFTRGEHDSREQEPLSLPLQQGIVVSRDMLVDTAMLLATVAAVLIVILLSHVHLMRAHRVERQQRVFFATS